MKKTIVGRSERVKLPELGVEVYAKVDSGAYFSSIDADLIEINGDELTYRLFRPDEEGYKSETVTTKDFKTRSTRSSNGQEQIRPMIELEIELEGRTTNALFSLANRSAMFYPILIGRNILRDDYLIDVTKGDVAKWDTSEF